MKKAILMVVISCISFSANAECNISFVRDGGVGAAFKKYGGWNFNNAEEFCAKLNRARARIQINAASRVLANQSIGWASVSVVDLDTSISTTSFGAQRTKVDTYASQDRADELMVSAINEAVENWDGIDKALASLDEERKKVRAMYGKRQ